MATQLDYNLSKQLSHPLFESMSIGLMSVAWGLFIFSAENYSGTDWYLWLISTRIATALAGFMLLLFVVIKKKYSQNLSVPFLTFSIAIQSSHGLLEGAKSVEFHNFTGLIFVLACLSFNGTFLKWLKNILPIQLFFILLPLLFKDSTFYSSPGVYLNNFSLLSAGLIIGTSAAYLTSSRYILMKSYLLEREGKYQLAKQVSHDLKSPLSFIRGVLAEGQYETTQKKQVIEMSLLRIESIADQLYSNAKEYKKYDIYEHLNLLNSEKSSAFSGKLTTFSFDISPDLQGVYTNYDFNDVITALSNIIDNAAEATQVEGNVYVAAERADDDLVIIVKDNGRGIPENILAKIYEKNFTFNKPKGTGLGLCQAKRAIENVQGTLQLIENSIDGAKFKIYIPNVFSSAIDKSNTIINNILYKEKIYSSIETPPRVILIDDDKFIRINWAMHFHSLGIQFNSFRSIDEFLKEESTINKDSHIFIDSWLGDGVLGEEESIRIYKKGYEKLFLATGHDKESIVKPSWIKEIFSKSPSNIYNLETQSNSL